MYLASDPELDGTDGKGPGIKTVLVDDHMESTVLEMLTLHTALRWLLMPLRSLLLW